MEYVISAVIFVAFVAGVIYLVRRDSTSSSSGTTGGGGKSGGDDHTSQH